jgi:N-acetylglucosamine-6-phosphate deacetylase
VDAGFLTGAAILHEGAWLHGHGVLIQGGVIRAVLPVNADVAAPCIGLPRDSKLAPGLVDAQVNGGGGILFNDDPSATSARAIAAAHRRLGTTAILPTRPIFFCPRPGPPKPVPGWWASTSRDHS